jgi:hypothetical protein
MLYARPVRVLLAAVAAAAALACAWLLVPGDTRAARGLELGIQDDGLFVQGNKRWPDQRSFGYAKGLGITRIRVNLHWAFTMSPAQAGARRRPGTIHYNFTQVDDLIDAARKRGIRVHLTLSGPSPRWANALKSGAKSWYKPNPREFGEFASVAASHFKGRVDRYSIWNEPNWKTWLGPLDAAPSIYREMYLFAYGAIKRADRKAKVLIGETSPYGRPGLSTSPLAFLRKVTCVNKRYRRVRGCPRLKADGYAHHPYDFAHPPGYRYPGGDNVTIGTLSRLTRALDKLKRSGALRVNGGGRMPIYLTEYGYFASGHRALSAKKRARYLQKAYSIALKNPRVKGQMQYLLLTLPPGSDSTFNTGLVSPGTGGRLSQYNALARWYRAHRGRVKQPGRAFRLPPRRANPSR